MIIDLLTATQIDKKITQETLNGYETAIREITNNNFQNLATRRKIRGFEANSVTCDKSIEGIRTGDTVEINGSKFNDGLYVVNSIAANVVNFLGASLYPETTHGAVLTKVEYPADIAVGLTKIIAFDVKTRDNIGVKSRTVSRWSESYHDITASTSTVNGYPPALFSFLEKYKKLRF